MSLSLRNFANMKSDPIAEEEDMGGEEVAGGQSIKFEGDTFSLRTIKSDDHLLLAKDLYHDTLSDAAQMESHGLPTQFGGTESGPSKKKAKRIDYYCEICNVELNSEETKNTHLQGAKHIKKTMAFGKRAAEGNRDGAPEVKLESGIRTMKTNNSKKTFHIRLKDKLIETQQAVIGMKYITEIIACSSAEVDPKYLCHLCGNQGDANGIINHLLGKAHRELYLRKLYPDERKYIDMSQSEVRREAEKHRENNKAAKMIETIYSDEQYPWPAGKAPW